MSIIDDLTTHATDALERVTEGASDMMDKVLDATTLDEQAIAMATEKIGAENVQKLKDMLARVSDGSISHEDIVMSAKEMGVPDTAVEMVLKFLGK